MEKRAMLLFGRIDRLPWFFYEKENVLIKISNIWNKTCVRVDMDKMTIERGPIPEEIQRQKKINVLDLISEHQLMEVMIYDYISSYSYVYEEMNYKKAFYFIVKRNRVFPKLNNLEDFDILVKELREKFKN